MSDEREPRALLRQGAKYERQLLLDEQRAERALLKANERLADAERTLEKAQQRANRRREQRLAAVDSLRVAQTARAAGLADPDLSPPLLPSNENKDEEPAPQNPPTADERTSPPERDDTKLPPRDQTTSSADDDEPSDPRPTRRRKPRTSAKNRGASS